jgi:hypothetical protein
VNLILANAFDLLLTPFGGRPWLALVVVSFVTGVGLLAVFRYTSNQRGIRRSKAQIMADLLEVLLYRDDMRAVLRAQGRLLLHNAVYLRYALPPMIFVVIPFVLFAFQLELRYGHRALAPGESAIIGVAVAPDVSLDEVTLSVPEGMELETPALRMPSVNEVDWRIRAEAPGEFVLRVGAQGEEHEKRVVVGTWGERISMARVAGGFVELLKNPGERPLPDRALIQSIRINYPETQMRAFGWSMFWLWPWLILSMIFGYALKGPLGVQI